MPRARRRSRAVAAIAAVGLFLQTTAPMGLTAAQAGAKPSPAGQASAPAKAAPQAGAAPATDRSCCSASRRRRLAANLRPAERRDDPRLSAAGGELGEADTSRRLQRRLAAGQGCREARDWHHQDRSGYAGIGHRAPGELPENEDRRSQFPDAAEGADSRDYDRDRQGDS